MVYFHGLQIAVHQGRIKRLEIRNVDDLVSAMGTKESMWMTK
ncbi:hypothetical protein Alches_17600 [Alicyclobacillus hesperidum subsp. aegles]|nr:hypothetical protein Alches_17600 [Alicyclobacillus hesperidum subsp. aegles]